MRADEDTKACSALAPPPNFQYLLKPKTRVVRLYAIFISTSLSILSCASAPDQPGNTESSLRLEEDSTEGTISVFRTNGSEPILVQNAKPGIRPYIHPIKAPDGSGELTEYSPAHHKHQTGLYWGLKQVNGRDYFMNWKGDYWKRVSSATRKADGDEVRWETVYDLLDSAGTPILRETQAWSMREKDDYYVLDLVWNGEARRDITMKKFYVGGLFLRMPWRKGVRAEAVNAAGQRNGEAEGQRAIWNDVAVQLDGRTDMAHIAMLDHPDNSGFPIAWRVDNEFGVGPSRQISGDWTIPAGQSETIRYRLIVYTGNRDDAFLSQQWKSYVCEPVANNP